MTYRIHIEYVTLRRNQGTSIQKFHVKLLSALEIIVSSFLFLSSKTDLLKTFIRNKKPNNILT